MSLAVLHGMAINLEAPDLNARYQEGTFPSEGWEKKAEVATNLEIVKLQEQRQKTQLKLNLKQRQLTRLIDESERSKLQKELFVDLQEKTENKQSSLLNTLQQQGKKLEKLQNLIAASKKQVKSANEDLQLARNQQQILEQKLKDQDEQSLKEKQRIKEEDRALKEEKILKDQKRLKEEQKRLIFFKVFSQMPAMEIQIFFFFFR